MADTLTKPQLRALSFLDNMAWSSPAELGCALSDKPHISAQGAGRIGGSMGTRLVAMGFAEHHYQRWRDAMHAYGYKITAAGRAALKEHSDE